MSPILTKELLHSYLHCPTKLQLKLRTCQASTGSFNALRGSAESFFDLSNPAAFDASVFTEDIHTLASIAKTNAFAVKNVSLVTDGVRWFMDGLLRQPGKSALGNFHYAPVVFNDNYRIEAHSRTLLNLYAEVLHASQGCRPGIGFVYLATGSKARRLTLQSKQFKYRKLRADLYSSIQCVDPPPLLLNSHCDACEFAERCRALAVQADNLSLLRFVPLQTQRILSKRGITTVNQFAMTYRPRKKSFTAGKPARQHALQALAIKEKKTFILGTPDIPNGDVTAFLDVEGDPDRELYYLVGVTVVSSTERSHHSFWCDNWAEQSAMVEKLLSLLEHSNVDIVCAYGSYEAKFLRAARHLTSRPEVVDKFQSKLVNVLSIIHAHFYFPTYSNGLKEIASKFGFEWTDPKANGLRSIDWRRHWERSGEDHWKQRLLTYNKEDCDALELVLGVLNSATKSNGDSADIFDKAEAVLQSFRSRPQWSNNTFVTIDFKEIHQRASFDYQRDKVYFRKKGKSTFAHKYPNRANILKLKPDSIVELGLESCPHCGSKNLIKFENRARRRAYYDLRFNGRNVRRKVLHLKCFAVRCAKCQSVSVSEKFNRVREYGHSLQSWMTYLNLAHNVSLKSVAETVSSCFSLPISYPTVYNCRKELSYYYRDTYNELIGRLCTGSLVHCDETEVHVRGLCKGYVWVLTSLTEVAFVFRPTREPQFLYELLDKFTGVLVSDFYAGYDGLKCRQQRCLVHLVRDINTEMLANPWNAELKSLGTRFGAILREIIGCVDEHGLRRSKLMRYRKQVDAFFHELQTASCNTEASEKLRERLLKNREFLFTFIEFDGVPWNNNNAERAIKYFAAYRSRTDYNGTESSMNNYLSLLSIYVTCRYRRADFLRFLLSQESSTSSIRPKLCFSTPNEAFDLHPVGWLSRRSLPKSPSKLRQKKLTMLDRTTLIKRIAAGEKFTYLCFYGHTVAKDGTVGKTCFSQWYPATFTVDGVLYPTAEHWMMAGKARLFKDEGALERILAAPDPHSAKAIGREVRGFDDKIWKANCRQIVTEGNVHKFSQNEELKALLLATGDAVLVEAAPRDQIWGIGLGADNPRAQDPSQWRDQNLLGFALMDVREKLRES